MTRRARIVFLALGGLQLALPLGTVGWTEVQIARGTEVRLQTIPVDPRDLFRGDYVVLRYEISSVGPSTIFKRGDTVYVPLRKVGPRWMDDYAHKEKPEARPFIRGRATQGSTEDYNRFEVEYGIETYFIEAGTGRKYEDAEFLYVDVSIDRNGKARIKGVKIPGQ